MGGVIFLIIVIVLVLWILSSCIKIVPQAYAVVLNASVHIAQHGTQVFISNCRSLREWQEK